VFVAELGFSPVTAVATQQLRVQQFFFKDKAFRELPEGWRNIGLKLLAYRRRHTRLASLLPQIF
jgi:hypothetical protein